MQKCCEHSISLKRGYNLNCHFFNKLIVTSGWEDLNHEYCWSTIFSLMSRAPILFNHIYLFTKNTKISLINYFGPPWIFLIQNIINQLFCLNLMCVHMRNPNFIFLITTFGLKKVTSSECVWMVMSLWETAKVPSKK